MTKNQLQKPTKQNKEPNGLLLGIKCECGRFIDFTKEARKQKQQVKDEVVEMVEEILKQGHGGGNWRRLINQLKDKLGK